MCMTWDNQHETTQISGLQVQGHANTFVLPIHACMKSFVGIV